MFWSLAERENIGDFLGTRLRLGRYGRQVGLIPEEELRGIERSKLRCAVIWALDPAESLSMPVALLTADGDERDWLAWLSTFALAFRPFTAYCRVLSARDFSSRLEARKPIPELNRIDGACVGLILGELLSDEEVAERPREQLLTVSEAAGTLSFALVRALAIYERAPNESQAERKVLAGRWEVTRLRTRERGARIDAAEISTIVDTLESARREERHTFGLQDWQHNAVRALVSNGGVLTDGLRPVANGLFEFDLADSATREERVTAFSRAMRVALEQQEPYGAFILGYLANRLNPGTFSHASLLRQALSRYPTVMLWYGVCAGLTSRSSLLGSLGGLARRTLRELLAPHSILETPNADVGWEELPMVFRGRGGGSPDFITATPSCLSVELDAGVWSTVNLWRADQQRSTEWPEARRWALSEIRNSLGRLSEVYNRLQADREREERGNYGEREGGRALQTSLLPDVPRGRARKR